MSKWNALWETVGKDGRPELIMSFEEIRQTAGIPMDHSFLTFKKELAKYGYQVQKISMKEQTVRFQKLEEKP